MNRRIKILTGLCLASVLWIFSGILALGAEKQDLHISEGIEEQIEYMVSSAMHLREYMLQSDETPPEILGLQDLVVKVGESLSYKRGVTVQDNSGVSLELVIDNTQVDLSQTGTYTVYYTATDLSGNVTSREVLVTVIDQDPVDPEVVYALADDLIAQLLTDDMTDREKVWKLFEWCRTKIKYSYTSGARTVYEGAYEGLHDRKGDCYIYYASMEVLLDRLGIDNMKVARVNGVSNHWWNLVNLGDGWYHLDSSPRQKGDPYKCFLQTDEQVAAYSAYYEAVNPGHPNYYAFDPSLYPERSTEITYESAMNPMP